ncbi:winged helix-turn-helix transcriptional regulator [Teichococcus deserti]|uniref:winged helix-turn-helix transcriptional regulator n=1 Tax=Teichococcus deserti TaxID=1817963 RepID=UPI000977F3A8
MRRACRERPAGDALRPLHPLEQDGRLKPDRLIDGTWDASRLVHPLEGRLRVNALRRRLPGVTRRMLTSQLRELAQGEPIARTVCAQVPPRLGYGLSELRRS